MSAQGNQLQMTSYYKPSVWGIMLDEMSEKGYSHEQLSHEVGKTRRCIYNWRMGVGEPSYTQACIVLSIYRTLVGSTDRKYLSDFK
jgi:hypothetical protein